MNCAECRENLVACLEGLIEGDKARQCREHIESCEGCRGDYAAFASLHQQLLASGRAAAGVSIVAPVMRRVHEQNAANERTSIMSILRTRWGLGLGAALGAAAAVAALLALTTPRAQAKAADFMTRGAQAAAKLASIHLRGQMRTLPADNFSMLDPESELVPIELWKQNSPELKWRIDKPGRFAVMDGQSTLLYMKAANEGVKLPQASRGAFDTEWLHRIADLSGTLTNQLNKALAKGWKLSLADQQGADGKAKAMVTIQATAGLPENDILKNKFFDLSDTRQVYRFDVQSEFLEDVQAYLATTNGEILVFELSEIDYNQPIDPQVFQPQLPANVNWFQDEANKLPDNEKYAAMTAAQAAKAFFAACASADWAEAGKFLPMAVDARFKQYVGGLEVLSLADTATSSALAGAGQTIPYEIKLKNGQVVKNSIWFKKDPKTGRWFFDGGL